MIALCTVGEVNKTITVSAGGFNLAGFTATLYAAPGNQSAPESNLSQATALGPLTLLQDAATGEYLMGYYRTQQDDFLSAGPWTLWLNAVNTETGEALSSAPLVVYVFPAPAQYVAAA